MKVEISVPSRMHVTLLDLQESGYRRNGGIGFSLNTPALTITICKAREHAISDSRQLRFSYSELDLFMVEAAIDRLQAHVGAKLPPYKIDIAGKTPSHSGFGCGTGIILACIEGIALLAGINIRREDMVALSNRGGTSGIGIHSYFEGGFIFDLGRKMTSAPFAPSERPQGKISVPLLINRQVMPPWQIGICVPSIRTKSVEEELRFFQETCPIRSSEVSETVYHAVVGVLGAVAESNREAFCYGIRNIQKCAWKAAERAQYNDGISQIETMLYAEGALAVGMSSLGPGLFFIADDLERVIYTLRRKLPEHEWGVSEPENYGRRVRYV